MATVTKANRCPLNAWRVISDDRARDIEADASVPDLDDPVGLLGELAVVCDDDKGRLELAVDLAQDLVDDLGRVRIEVRSLSR